MYLFFFKQSHSFYFNSDNLFSNLIPTIADTGSLNFKGWLKIIRNVVIIIFFGASHINYSSGKKKRFRNSESSVMKLSEESDYSAFAITFLFFFF